MLFLSPVLAKNVHYVSSAWKMFISCPVLGKNSFRVQCLEKKKSFCVQCLEGEKIHFVPSAWKNVS